MPFGSKAFVLGVLAGVAAVACGSSSSVAPPDAGAVVDSGSSPDLADSGVPDAGAFDAGLMRGTDAGVLDAGNLDAGIGDAGAGAPDAGTLVGFLIGGPGPAPGAIQGVHYRSATLAGFTSDAGAFAYRTGETITFSVADVDFRPTPGASWVSPWQLAPQGLCSPSDSLTRLLVLLDSADSDGDLANGLQLPPASLGSTQRSFAGLVDGDVANLVATLGLDGGAASDGGGLVDGGVAVVNFIVQMDGETWQQVGLDAFSATAAEQRSQGVSTDGTNWYFSWQLGFEETDQSYQDVNSNALAIPTTLALQGVDHMGDCDFFDGGLYAGAEDGSAYQHPYVLQFDASLNFIQGFALSPALMTQGVPWAAVDPVGGHLIVANWDPTPELFLLDLSTGTYLSSITLSQTLGRIQGAKVFEGALYASTSDQSRGIYKIDLATGVVIPLWQFGFVNEEEGCAFLPQADGALFHTLDVTPNRNGMEFRHHQRTRDPLRKLVCP